MGTSKKKCAFIKGNFRAPSSSPLSRATRQLCAMGENMVCSKRAHKIHEALSGGRGVGHIEEMRVYKGKFSDNEATHFVCPL